MLLLAAFCEVLPTDVRLFLSTDTSRLANILINHMSVSYLWCVLELIWISFWLSAE